MRVSFKAPGSIVGVVGASLLAASVAIPAIAAPVTEGRLAQAANEPENWLMTYGQYNGNRYSALSEINRNNVANLRVAFTMPIKTEDAARPGFQGPPLVDGGMMFLSNGHGIIHKIDVRDGANAVVLWRADPAVDKENNAITKGVGLYRDLVINGLPDARIVAVDRESGEFVWDNQIGRVDPPWVPVAGFYDVEKFDVAPVIADGKAIFGIANGDFGLIGWVNAVDAMTGEEVWRTYTIPLPGQPGHETWADDHNAWMTGGAAIWTTGTYDPDTNITYWGTANPVPMFDPEFRPGDNLWSNSALAFDVATGDIVWGFQYTANESWDYDENGVHLLYDANIGGVDRKVVAHFARNGFFYQLDRTTGDFINAVQYVADLNWTEGLDPKTGKAVEYDPSLLIQTYRPFVGGVRNRATRAEPDYIVCPTAIGGVRFQPTAFNPLKQIAYAAGAEGCSDLTVIPEDPVGPQGGNPKGQGEVFLGGLFSNENLVNPAPWYGGITAVDIATMSVLAKKIVPLHNESGMLATAGGIVFTGHRDGKVVAYNDETLEELWTFNTGIHIKSPLITYAFGGKQFVAVKAGGRPSDDANQATAAMLFVFSL